MLILPAAVPDDINRLSIDYLEGNLAASPMHIPRGMSESDLERIRRSYAPATILLERWFMEGVALQPALAGALRSLLGPSVGLPIALAHHGGSQPVGPAQGWCAPISPSIIDTDGLSGTGGGRRHQDADAVFGPELNYLEVTRTTICATTLAIRVLHKCSSVHTKSL